MIQSKTIDLLSRMTGKEFTQFGKYLESPVFNTNKSLPKIFKLLKKFYPEFTSVTLTKEYLYKSAYGSAAFNDAKLRKLLSDMFREAEKFIVIQSALAEKDIYQKILLKQYDRRKLDTLFTSKYEEYGAYLDKGKKNSDYFLEKFLSEWRNVLFHMERGMQHKITANIYKRTEYLIFFFLCDLSLSMNDITAQSESFNFKSSIKLPEEFIRKFDHENFFKYIQNNDFENIDIVHIYYMGYLLTEHIDDEKYYYRLKEFTIKNAEKFDNYLLRASLLPLINHCVRVLNFSNNRKFEMELYEHYGLYIKNKLYNISGKNYIRNDILLNIFSNYFAVGKISEMKEFLEDNIQIIQPSHRKNMTALLNALINFENKNFGESLMNLALMKSNTLLYKDTMKILAMKNHYELRNYEIARELANSYAGYLKKKENMTEFRKSKRTRFLQYYNTLWKFYDGKKVSLKEIQDEISRNDTFLESRWIVSKIDELISKKPRN